MAAGWYMSTGSWNMGHSRPHRISRDSRYQPSALHGSIHHAGHGRNALSAGVPRMLWSNPGEQMPSPLCKYCWFGFCIGFIWFLPTIDSLCHTSAEDDVTFPMCLFSYLLISIGYLFFLQMQKLTVFWDLGNTHTAISGPCRNAPVTLPANSFSYITEFFHWKGFSPQHWMVEKVALGSLGV